MIQWVKAQSEHILRVHATIPVAALCANYIRKSKALARIIELRVGSKLVHLQYQYSVLNLALRKLV